MGLNGELSSHAILIHFKFSGDLEVDDSIWMFFNGCDLLLLTFFRVKLRFTTDLWSYMYEKAFFAKKRKMANMT